MLNFVKDIITYRDQEPNRTHEMVEALSPAIEAAMTEPTDFVANAKATFNGVLSRLNDEIADREEAMRKLRFELDGLYRVKQAHQVATVKLNNGAEKTWEEMQP